MLSCRNWDVQDGDAMFLESIKDATFDFVHSSHCLEHLENAYDGIGNWLRVLKSGGYLIVTIPETNLYEHGYWPSRFNGDHKTTFSINNPDPKPHEITTLKMLQDFTPAAEVERLILHRDFFDDSLPAATDQTWTGNAECAIEFVLRKR